MQSLFAILCLTTIPVTWSQTCGPRISPRLMNEIPCDMSKTFYCQVPGPGYPFSSVRRYIYENQGLMRRMYGDQRQSFVVRNEIEDLHEKYDFSPFNGRHTSSNSRKSFLKFSPRSAFNDPEKEPQPSSTPTVSETSSELLSSTSSPTILSTTTQNIVAREINSNISSDFSATETTNLPESSETTTITTPINITAEPIIVPLPSSTNKPEEPPVIDDTKKGFNACPVKEEVVAPYWANNTRVSNSLSVGYNETIFLGRDFGSSKCLPFRAIRSLGKVSI